MAIGIIGAGALGSSLAKAFARSGVKAMISNRRGPESLAALIAETGPNITAVTVAEAAAADIVFAAMRWEDVERVLSALPAWNGRIVVDATNPVAFLAPDSPDRQDPSNPLASYGIKPIDLGGRHSSDVFRAFVPGARIVKAFNHLDVQYLAEPELAGGQRVLFYSGDDLDAKAEIQSLIETLGFFSVDLGRLNVGGPLAQLPFGPLSTTSFVKV